MWASVGPGPSLNSPKQWKSDSNVKNLQLCLSLSARDRHWRNQKNKNIESSNIKACESVYCRAQCHAKWAIVQQRVSAPCKNRTQVARLTIDHWAISSYRSPERNIIWLVVSHNLEGWNHIFACRIVVLGLLRLYIKTRHDIEEFLTANLWSIHLIAFDIDWSWNIFTLHIFAKCSSSSSSASKKWEVRTWNLGQIFEIWLWAPPLSGWSVTQ